MPRRSSTPTLHSTTTTQTQQFWDDLYGGRGQRWSGEVNALWLGERGWQVTAVDISTTALDRAQAEAARRGLSVDWLQRDLVAPLPPGPYDLVSAQFLQSPIDFPRADVLRHAAAVVAPGGSLLVVSHAAPPPWSTHRPNPALMPPAETVLAELELDAEQREVVEVVGAPRSATGPDGQPGELVDSVVHVRRR